MHILQQTSVQSFFINKNPAQNIPRGIGQSGIFRFFGPSLTAQHKRFKIINFIYEPSLCSGVNIIYS